MRYATLVMNKLPSHPSAKDPENRAGLKAADKTIPQVIEEMELLRPRINARYNAWQKALEKRRIANAPFEDDSPRTPTNYSGSDPAVAGNVTTLGAAENSDLAVRLAHNEIRRRETRRRATKHSAVSAAEDSERRTAGLWDDWEAALSRDGPSRDDDEMRRNMEASRRRMDGSHDSIPEGARKRPPKAPPRPARPPAQNGTNEYRYPTIPKSQPFQYDDRVESRTGSPLTGSPSVYLPPKPPKERFLERPSSKDGPPIRPEKINSVPPAHSDPPARPEKALDDSIPKSPPANFTFRPSAYLENGKPLRTVFLPPLLRSQFLKIAEPNTRRNLETCGMLCGTLISNALFISKVVIPEQESTSDTCDTVNESAFFDYCAAEDLMVLGWIHTHPSQTCFMSSRDLHTHAGYQIMMPESIAIVCAPSRTPSYVPLLCISLVTPPFSLPFPDSIPELASERLMSSSWGVFRLTDPPGMQSVLNCRKTGLFHPHDEDNIYTDALKPGHVFEAPGLEFDVVDLRP
jgi:STAM-binding protein